MQFNGEGVQHVAFLTDDLIKTGTVTRGFLGVGIQDVTRDIADSVGAPTA